MEKTKSEQKVTNKFNITMAGLGLLGILTVGGIKLDNDTDHLNCKCPFSFLFKDKVIEHSVDEVNKEYYKVYKAPEGYTLNGNLCYKDTIQGRVYTEPILVGIMENDTIITNDEVYTRVKKLYNK